MTWSAEDRRRWESANRERIRARSREIQCERRAWLNGLKGTTCSECGGTFEPRRLHWHHRDQESKLFSLTKYLRGSRAKLLVEVAKCDVLCVACHAQTHVAAKPRDAQGRFAPEAC